MCVEGFYREEELDGTGQISCAPCLSPGGVCPKNTTLATVQPAAHSHDADELDVIDCCRGARRRGDLGGRLGAVAGAGGALLATVQGTVESIHRGGSAVG